MINELEIVVQLSRLSRNIAFADDVSQYIDAIVAEVEPIVRDYPKLLERATAESKLAVKLAAQCPEYHSSLWWDADKKEWLTPEERTANA